MNPIDHQKLRELIIATTALREIEAPFEKSREALANAPKGSDDHSKRIKADLHNAHWKNGVERGNLQERVDKLLVQVGQDLNAWTQAANLHNVISQYR